MADYFLLLDAAEFHKQFRPALGASWRGRSFTPCRALCQALLPRMRSFAAKYHLGSDEPLLAQVAAGLPFDRTFWHHLVGEVLWYGAIDIPEVQTAEKAWACLLAQLGAPLAGQRVGMPAIMKVLHGSRDLIFGGGFYRPEAAGWNDVADVLRLAQYLGSVDVTAWRPEGLAPLVELSPEDRREELADAQAWFPALLALYRQAAADRRVIVGESL
jgi:hypothetical protein